jgi:hypothetical protein
VSTLQTALAAAMELYRDGGQNDMRLQNIVERIAKKYQQPPRQLYQAARGRLGAAAPRQKRIR